MVGEVAGPVLVPVVPDDLGQVLDEIAAARDVEQLRAAADRQHGHVARERRLEQRELRLVAPRLRRVGRRVRLGPVQVRVEVAAAGEDHAVERVERLLDRALHGRDDERPPARVLHRPHVDERDERRVLVPDAHLHLLRVRGDPDQRLHARSKHPLALVAGDDLVEEALLGARVVQVVVDDLVAERLAGDRAEPRAPSIASRSVCGKRFGVRLVGVALERRRQLELVLDPVQPGGEHRGEREVRVDVAARDPRLRPQRRAVADDRGSRTCGCRSPTRASSAPSSRPRSACTS